MLVVAAGAVHLLGREQAVAAAGARLARADPAQAESAAPLPPDAPPRALLADALWRAQAALTVPPGARRRALLDRALAETAICHRTRRWWGEAWAVTAFALEQRDGRGAPAALAALARSYDDAPYLRHTAEWRVDYALSAWPALDPATRARSLDEAVWLGRSGVEALDAVLDVARGSAAYRPFMLRWIAARRDDRDFARR